MSIVKTGANAAGALATTYQAAFINKVGLNLARDHHSVSYPAGLSPQPEE
jgi:hypothetical protein